VVVVPLMGRQWSDGDRQRFADRNILKALRIPGRRKPAPDADEWGSTWLDDPYRWRDWQTVKMLDDERAAEQRLTSKSDHIAQRGHEPQ